MLTGAVLAAAVAGLALSLLGRPGGDPAPRAAAVPANWARPAVSAAGLAQRSGVRITQVAVTGNGGLVDLRFQVVDPDRAGALHDAATPPAVVDEQSGLVVHQLFMGHSHTGAYRATYWLLNGRAYPDTAPGITAAAGQRVLLRYLNAGFDNTTMRLLGMHERVVARDARLLNNPFDADAETIPAGATEDAIATVPATAPPSQHGFPLYNRQLHLTNGVQSGPDPSPATGGGMLTFIHP
jgi:hypothetical protein